MKSHSNRFLWYFDSQMSLQKKLFENCCYVTANVPKNFSTGCKHLSKHFFTFFYDTGFVEKVIACSYDAYWSIYSRKSTKSWIFTHSMSKIQLDFERIPKTSFFPNYQSLSPSGKKLVRHIKNGRWFKGLPFDGLSRTEIIGMIALTIRLVEG